MDKPVKYALFKYSTANIGDEIQSIAARRFLPRVDYYIDRDYLGGWKNKNQDETVKLIANAWYCHHRQAWPPHDKTLELLPISMHISPNVSILHDDDQFIPRESFAAKESVDYLKGFSEVGARDVDTCHFLTNHGVNAYFSGCLTLTLQPDSRIKRQDFILAVDVSDELVDFLRAKTNRRIIKMSPYGDFDLSTKDRFVVAEYFLYLYQSAHAVVTTRLHSALPCLSFETPVLLIKQGWYDADRFSGLDNLVRSATESEYIRDYNRIFNLDRPKSNYKKHLKYRDRLIKKCSEFTGFDNEETFLWTDPLEFTSNESMAEVFLDSYRKKYKRIESIKRLEDEINNRDAQISDINNRLSVCESDKQKIDSLYSGLLYDYNSIKNTSLKYVARTLYRKLSAK